MTVSTPAVSGLHAGGRLVVTWDYVSQCRSRSNLNSNPGWMTPSPKLWSMRLTEGAVVAVLVAIAVAAGTSAIES